MGGILKACECAVNQALTPARQFLLKEMDSFVSLSLFQFSYIYLSAVLSCARTTVMHFNDVHLLGDILKWYSPSRVRED